MTDDKRKLLTAALGEKWYEVEGSTEERCSCGEVRMFHDEYNRSFTTAQDWEDLREKVVVPNIEQFKDYIHKTCRFGVNYFMWWLTLSPEECCQLVADFRKEIK